MQVMINKGDKMENEEKTLVFELKDLSFEELIETYKTVLEFLKYLDEAIVPMEQPDPQSGGDIK